MLAVRLHSDLDIDFDHDLLPVEDFLMEVGVHVQLVESLSSVFHSSSVEQEDSGLSSSPWSLCSLWAYLLHDVLVLELVLALVPPTLSLSQDPASQHHGLLHQRELVVLRWVFSKMMPQWFPVISFCQTFFG